jgi:hypothetical protein
MTYRKNKSTWAMRKIENHWYEIGFQSGSIFLPIYHVKWRVVADEVLKLLQGRKSRMRMKFFILSLKSRCDIKEVL